MSETDRPEGQAAAGGVPPAESPGRPVPLSKRFANAAASLALLVVSAVATLAVSEFVARRVGLGDPVLYTTNLTSRYELAPNQNVGRFSGARIHVDSMGLRSVRDWALPADRKILFLGDSVTYGGSYVDTAELFPERVCAHIGLEGTTTCGNGGVNAYGTDNVTARVVYKPFDDESAIVVTLIAADALRGMADVHSLPYFTRKPAGPFRALIELYAFAADRMRLLVRFGGEPVEHPANREHEEDVAAASLDRLFDALRDRIREGKAVLVVFSPRRLSVEAGLQPLESLVLGRVRESGLDYLDMTSVLAGNDLGAIYYDKVHLNPFGHDFYGRHIAGRLRDHLR